VDVCTDNGCTNTPNNSRCGLAEVCCSNGCKLLSLGCSN
jgi:hypothetical protein